jgi:putative membrane-bound dehydrogenase-like protein
MKARRPSRFRLPEISPMLRPSVLVFAALALLLPHAPLSAEELGVRVPEGFEVSLFADDTLAHDIYSMTVDAQGRVVVAGAGYVKILHDTDGDGRAERASLFSPLPASGAHGMYFDGPDLICSGDNSIMRLRDADGDGVADREPEVWTPLRHPEHGANGLVRGPDGCYYLVCGNDAGISQAQITSAASPVKSPRSGVVVRFSPEGRPLDVYAHGFRNPYDLDFDADGHLVTVDSDGERDHHLPWYAPTRLFDVAQGMEHGWLLKGWTRGWNRPQSFFDNVERMVEIGRGSPTGLLVYRHRGFPAYYRGGVFSACWTFGRVYYFPIEACGATSKSKLEVFMQTTGDVGFAPCDLAVGPQGDLFVAIGGRRTRGSVFRVRYRGPADTLEHASPLEQVLGADQPLASWSRARWIPIARQLGKSAFEEAVADDLLDVARRVRAVEVIVELFGPLDPKLSGEWTQSKAPEVRARLAWGLGRGPTSSDAAQLLARLTADPDPRVQRAAWESLATATSIDPLWADQPDWPRGLASSERRVRAAAIAVARSAGEASYGEFLSRARLASDAFGLRMAQLWINVPDSAADTARGGLNAGDVSTCLRVFAAAGPNRVLQLEAVRWLQIALGDVSVAEGQAEVYCGYLGRADVKQDPSLCEAIARSLAPAFPTADAELNRELARLLGMLHAERAGLLDAIAGMWNDKSTVDDDIHYLIVASLLPGKRTTAVTAATASCLLSLHPKLEALGQFASRNWPFRVGEVFDELCRRDPDLAGAMLASNRFGHPEHSLFVERLQEDARRAATRLLWITAEKRGEAPSAQLVALVGRLSENEAPPLLRSKWDEANLRDAIVLALARHPDPSDRSKFVEALSSPQPGVVAKAAQSLVPLGINCSSSEMAAALRALKLACDMPKNTEPRQSLLRLLNFWTEENSDVDTDPDPAQTFVGWYELFEQYYPAEAAGLKASSGADAATWKRRLAQVDWSGGDAARGRAVYERRACHRCHQVSGHLGPELKGAVARLSRDDLFTAIIDPNLEVSPAFQTTLIATAAGQVYHGLVVYESPEGILLQTGPDTTVRVTDVEDSSVRASAVSLMPTGLLDTLTDQDLSDLYAHLKTLSRE